MRTSRSQRKSTPVAYVERVNRAIDYIVGRLSEPMRLDEIARAAMLSPFHFHRVFQALMGETPADFVKRLRLDRALHLMSHGKRRSLTDVALACGFASSSDFSRCFRQRFGVPPSRFDLEAWRQEHAGALTDLVRVAARDMHLDRLPAGSNPDKFRVRIRELPARKVAYILVKDPYRVDVVPRAAERLVTWADRNGLADGQWLGYMWENPELVALEDCRYYVAVEAEQFTPKGEVGMYRFPEMTVAQVEIRGGIDLELRALQWLYGTWLPKSGYVPDDQPAFEAWIGRPFAHGFEYFELYCHLPVRQA